MKQKKALNVQIGFQIKMAREKNNLTQEQFAEIIDRTPQFISDLERGISGISIETLKMICEKLCISSDSILFPDQEQHEDKVSRLINTFKRMSDSQFYVMEQITNTFLRAYTVVEDQRKQPEN